MIETYDCYAREIVFYRDIAAEVPLRIPRHHGSDFDPAKMRRVNEAAARAVDRLPTRAHLVMTRDVTKFMRPTKRRYALLLEDLGSGMVVHDLVEPPPARAPRADPRRPGAAARDVLGSPGPGGASGVASAREHDARARS